MTHTEKTYFAMLAIYHKASESGTPKQLSKVLLALEDFERRYYNTNGFGALMNLMDSAQQRGLYVH
ncbi:MULTISPECIES: hypothetical protein [Bacillus]|uniref:hypothetical protein n=1 Tax=Bacillus TaxID=1386 RepID=UPI00099233FA|nr:MULTISPECIES: hypothetical protein [Bacillus]MBJ8063824.1 hypothetical protein [Bacillus cereus group sp. N15]MCS3594972.1 hypothetical protein [Bacillus sp. JUb91]OOR57145.1 hypothetical protein BGP34_14990 [Bacillus mycoides]PEB28999.1 hypothetical protein COO14_19025 [Bacillus toyonensis]TBX47826.1 hypothetical protein E0M44_14225 [Bacillus toyonensis]